MRRLILILMAGLLIGSALTLAVEHLLIGSPANHAAVWRPDAGYWPYPEKVNWSQHRPGLQKEIDGAGDAGDCATINRLMVEQLDADAGPEVWTYVERWGKHLHCQDFQKEQLPPDQ